MEDLEKYEKYMEYINSLLGELEENGVAVIDIDGGEIIKGVIEDLQESVEYTMDCYQDAGKKMFEYTEQIEKARKWINDILDSCNGANCGDLQMLLDILEVEDE